MRTDKLKADTRPSLPSRPLSPESFLHFCSSALGVTPSRIERDLELWLAEDHGSGDVTVRALPEALRPARMFVLAKEDFVLAGLPLMAHVFRLSCGPQASLFSDFDDGEMVKKGQVVLAGMGTAAGLLLGERVALNLGSRLSGIATSTRRVKDALEAAAQVEGTAPPALLETRKTTPGLRLYEKYATRAGGALNHRHGLDTGAMLKENHLRTAGSIVEALRSLKSKVPLLTKIEVEVTNLDEFRLALAEGADVIMLDNFTSADLAEALAERRRLGSQTRIEISGNLDTRDPRDLVLAGIDFASMGALIHQARWVDLSLQLFPETGEKAS